MVKTNTKITQEGLITNTDQVVIFIVLRGKVYGMVMARGGGGFSLLQFQVGLVTLLVVGRKIRYLFFHYLWGVFLIHIMYVFLIHTFNVCLELCHLSTLMQKQHSSIRWINVFFTYGCRYKHANSVCLELCWIHVCTRKIHFKK